VAEAVAVRAYSFCNLILIVVTNVMEHSSSWEANSTLSCSSRHKIACSKATAKSYTVTTRTAEPKWRKLRTRSVAKLATLYCWHGAAR
jgi:hypothetical protein